MLVDELAKNMQAKKQTDLILLDFSKAFDKVAHEKKKVQVGKDQEKAQSEKDSQSKNRGGKKPN